MVQVLRNSHFAQALSKHLHLLGLVCVIPSGARKLTFVPWSLYMQSSLSKVPPTGDVLHGPKLHKNIYMYGNSYSIPLTHVAPSMTVDPQHTAGVSIMQASSTTLEGFRWWTMLQWWVKVKRGLASIWSTLIHMCVLMCVGGRVQVPNTGGDLKTDFRNYRRKLHSYTTLYL